MYIYAFGSICRGEIDFYSDIDLIAISDNKSDLENLDPNKFSIYTVKRLKEYWEIGNPFAWHLYKESRLIFSSKADDLIKRLGEPSPYKNGLEDLNKFYNIFLDSVKHIEITRDSFLFDISTIFLSVRNFATCYSLTKGQINFQRNSALNLGKKSIQISIEDYKALELARLLATRGVGTFPNEVDSSRLISCFNKIDEWMRRLLDDCK
ncbi:nucleotidyltransferase domain-containing protein [Acinetobacter sp. YH12140]|uniref:nucleotidyltransferase domain-containing protein n=1 Tax=Acinetobacter sp. YH12140 TaxID=2601124 RepID=UPI0015D25BA3|nr:nucleotidyltransferase domain-containing protein [Acinetobacter sp. YH12140]